MKASKYLPIYKIAFFCLLLLNSQIAVKSQIILPYSVNDLPKDHNLWLSVYDNFNSSEWIASNGIKECSIKIFKFKNNVVVDKEVDAVTYKFDRNGYVAESKFNNGKNKLISVLNENNQIVESWAIEGGGDTLHYMARAYDSLGRLVQIEYILKKGMYVQIFNIGSLERPGAFKKAIFKYAYNDQNLPSQLMVYAGDKLHPNDDYEYYRERYVYNEQKQLVEILICMRESIQGALSKTFSDAQCSYRVQNFYNMQGLMIKSDFYSPDYVPIAGAVGNKKPKGFFMWIFTDDGKLLEYQSYDAMGKLQTKHVNVLDSKGNVNQSIYYDNYGTITSKIIQAFNERNQLVMKVAYNADNTIQSMYGFKYDDRGTKVEITEYDTSSQKPLKVYKLTYL